MYNNVILNWTELLPSSTSGRDERTVAGNLPHANNFVRLTLPLWCHTRIVPTHACYPPPPPPRIIAAVVVNFEQYYLY